MTEKFFLRSAVNIGLLPEFTCAFCEMNSQTLKRFAHSVVTDRWSLSDSVKRSTGQNSMPLTMGWTMGLEPTTTGITIRGSTN